MNTTSNVITNASKAMWLHIEKIIGTAKKLFDTSFLALRGESFK